MSIKILTWNIGVGKDQKWYWKYINNYIKYNPIKYGIICLQEAPANYFDAPKFTRAFYEKYHILHSLRGDNALVTLVNKNISEDIPSLKSHCVDGFFPFAQEVKFSSEGRNIKVFNVHLVRIKIENNFDINNDNRNRQIESLNLGTGDLICGDINSVNPRLYPKFERLSWRGSDSTYFYKGKGKQLDYIGIVAAAPGPENFSLVGLPTLSDVHYHHPVEATI